MKTRLLTVIFIKILLTEHYTPFTLNGSKHDKDQSKMWNHFSFIFARWQQQFEIASFVWGFDPHSPAPGGQGHHRTRVIGPLKCTCEMAPKSGERFKQSARMWQTDGPRYAELCTFRRNRLRCKKRLRLKVDILLFFGHWCTSAVSMETVPTVAEHHWPNESLTVCEMCFLLPLGVCCKL